MAGIMGGATVRYGVIQNTCFSIGDAF
uniref:Uncharacterized protein n=1 Tax=Anguilla anguilla TaxID=7936 RepID=A0A0E9RIA2_ANGAN